MQAGAGFAGKWRGGLHGVTFVVTISPGGEVYSSWMNPGGGGVGEFSGRIKPGGVAVGLWVDEGVQGGGRRSEAQVGAGWARLGGDVLSHPTHPCGTFPLLCFVGSGSGRVSTLSGIPWRGISVAVVGSEFRVHAVCARDRPRALSPRVPPGFAEARKLLHCGLCAVASSVGVPGQRRAAL
jgi:hypothetical protein